MQRDQKLYLRFMLDSKFVMILRSKSCKVAYVIAHFLSASPHFLLSTSSQRGKRESRDFMIFPSFMRSVDMAPLLTQHMATTRASVQSATHPTSWRFTLPLRYQFCM